MINPIRLCAGVLLAVAGLNSASASEPKFEAYLSIAGETRFVISTDEEKKSEWLGIGGQFAGYRITGFDARSETLDVEDALGKKFSLRIADGRVRTAKVPEMWIRDRRVVFVDIAKDGQLSSGSMPLSLAGLEARIRSTVKNPGKTTIAVRADAPLSQVRELVTNIQACARKCGIQSFGFAGRPEPGGGQ